MSTAAQSRAHNGKPPGIAREAWNFVAHPTAFFGARLQDKPNWAPALAAPILCAALQFASALLMSEKTQPIVRDLLIKQNMQAIDMHSFGVVAAVAASASYLVTCGMITLAVVCLDVLLKDSGRLPRLAEFTALSFFSQVPYCTLMVIAACLWSPEAIFLPAGASVIDMRDAVQEWRGAIFSWPLLSAARVISYYALAWQAFLLAVCMRVVSRITMRAALFAGGILLALFVFMQAVTSHH